MSAPARSPLSAEPSFNPGRGCWQVRLSSPHQNTPCRVDILLPDGIDSKKTYPVLYILPVEGIENPHYGDGLLEARKADLANKHQVICVYPGFSNAPWFGNHASDPRIRQEDHVLQVLIPFIEKNFPASQNKEDRWLLGFSKSGWGAYTLLLRHPETFGYAAAWDVPFMINGDNSGADWGPMAMAGIFGSRDNMRHYLPSVLAVEKSDWLKKRKRLVLGVGEFWKPQNLQMHALLEKHGVPHVCRNDLVYPHRWDSGWFAPIAGDLIGLARSPQKN